MGESSALGGQSVLLTREAATAGSSPDEEGLEDLEAMRICIFLIRTLCKIKLLLNNILKDERLLLRN